MRNRRAHGRVRDQKQHPSAEKGEADITEPPKAATAAAERPLSEPATADGALRTIDELPGPKRLPLLGNLHQNGSPARMHLQGEEWARRYGPIFRFYTGRRPFVGIADLEVINEILRDRPHRFRRSSIMEDILNEMGVGGVFAAEGETWKKQRRLVVAALNSNKLKRYFDVLRTTNQRLLGRLSQAADRGEALDVDEELMRYTVDITTALAFGCDLNTIEHGDGQLQQHIQRALAMTVRRGYIPIAYWRRGLKLPADRALDRSLVELHRAAQEFIDRARSQLEENAALYEDPENLLQAMLAAQRTEGKFTDGEIINNALVLLFAGEDTTAHTMAWTLWFLATRPRLQERWREEAEQALEGAPVPDTYETIERLPFGDAALREALRLKPAVPLTPVEPVCDTTIMGAHIPAGTQLFLLLRHASLSEGSVEHADQFDPDRWIEDNGSAPEQSSFLAFGAGPRFCPGRNLAFLEAKAAMATIARNFKLELDESHDVPSEHFRFTMGPQNLRVRLRPLADTLKPEEMGVA